MFEVFFLFEDWSLCLWSLIIFMHTGPRAQAWHTRSDDVSDLCISRPDFRQSAILKFYIRFLAKCNLEIPEILQVLHGNVYILRIWSWAENNKVYNYRLHFSRFPPLTDLWIALRRNRANTASDRFVLIAGSFLLRFIKPVIGLSNYVMGAAIKNVGHPGRRFLAALPLLSRSNWLKNRSNRQAIQAIKMQILFARIIITSTARASFFVSLEF